MPEPLRPPAVKVCGLRGAADLLAALEAGADAVGFVFHEASPRALREEDAPSLAGLVPAQVLAVAVFVDAAPDVALERAQRIGARAVQLCGAERPADWRGFPLPILRRLAVAPRAAEDLAAWDGVAGAFVLDHPQAPGGSGRAVDWELAAQLAAHAPCLLAGGLDEHNVAAAVRAVRPAGVDASSRLESAPGRKDEARVRAFVAAARRALQERTA